MNQAAPELEIIVIDDASPDDTVEMVRERYGDRVRLIESETNQGSIKNRNRGARLAQGEVLFLIDDDTEFPGAETVMEVTREFEKDYVGAIAIPYYQDGELRQSATETSEREHAVASYIGCASAIRRDLFLSLGGYEEFFHHQVEEDDLSIRMLNEGKIVKIARVSDPMTHYESPTRNFQRWDYLGRRNSILYIWKNAPLSFLLPNLLATTIRGVTHAVKVRRFKGNLTGLAAGYGGVLASLFSKGCSRKPVRRAVYLATLKLRKTPMPVAWTRERIEPR